MILTFLTLIDLFLFIFKNGLSSQRNRYVKKHVQIFSKLDNEEHKEVLAKFSNKFLKPDVVLVFKIIATNVNGIVVSELIKDLWDQYYKKHGAKSNFQDQENLNNYDNEEDIDKEPNDYTENLNILEKDGISLPKFPSPNESGNRKGITKSDKPTAMV